MSILRDAENSQVIHTCGFLFAKQKQKETFLIIRDEELQQTFFMVKHEKCSVSDRGQDKDPAIAASIQPKASKEF